MNKRHPYRGMERDYITAQLSIRELCRRHGISWHSIVADQAMKHGRAEKREAPAAKVHCSLTAARG